MKKIEINILILHDGGGTVELHHQYSYFGKACIFNITPFCKLELIKYRFNKHVFW